jgi:hypothetical protein
MDVTPERAAVRRFAEGIRCRLGQIADEQERARITNPDHAEYHRVLAEGARLAIRDVMCAAEHF